MRGFVLSGLPSTLRLQRKAAGLIFRQAMTPTVPSTDNTGRGAEQVVLLGTEKYQPEMEHADSGLEAGSQSVKYRI